MDNYLLLKLLHILGAVVLAGTGSGIAFFMFMAHRSGNVQAIAVTTRHVVLADETVWVAQVGDETSPTPQPAAPSVRP